MNDIAVNKLPETFVCPNCEFELTHEAGVQNHHAEKKKGDIILCSRCAAILVLGDNNLGKIKREEFNKLDSQSRATIRLLIASIVHNNTKPTHGRRRQG